jgi:hypothetical protein
MYRNRAPDSPEGYDPTGLSGSRLKNWYNYTLKLLFFEAFWYHPDMKLEITTPDPFHILTSTKYVLKNAKFVRLDETAVEQTARKIGDYLKDHADFPDHGHRLTGEMQTDMQLIFFESMMGFCFWAKPGEEKWSIELENGEKVDGWYGVCAAFKRAYDEGMPVTDANFLAEASKSDVQRIFWSTTEAEIPLLDKRVWILNENARVLKEHFGGQASRLVEAAEHDAIKLFKLLMKQFPSYRDTALYNGQEVVFLKIAHLLALDLEYRLTPRDKRPFLKNFDKLAVFADYKLPQLLRMYGILVYVQPFADSVDAYTVIPAGSPEEIEIRSSAIWGVELLRQALPHYSSMQIGHAIWLASQDQVLQAHTKPYHRTYTTFY